jgi:hypothetical protein
MLPIDPMSGGPVRHTLESLLCGCGISTSAVEVVTCTSGQDTTTDLDSSGHVVKCCLVWFGLVWKIASSSSSSSSSSSQVIVQGRRKKRVWYLLRELWRLGVPSLFAECQSHARIIRQTAVTSTLPLKCGESFWTGSVIHSQLDGN